MENELKQSCNFCGGHIAFEKDYCGKVVRCPHCAREITLEEEPQILADTKVQRCDDSVLVRSPKALKTAVALSLLVVVSMGIFWGLRMFSNSESEKRERQAEELFQATMETERAQEQAEKLKVETERIQKSEAAARAAVEAEVQAAAEAARLKAEEERRAEDDRRELARKSPMLWALWEEVDRETIRIEATRVNDASIRHKDVAVNVKYSEMPTWLREGALKKHKDDGEAKGLIREVDGKIYDLRTSPPGWVSLSRSEVIQIVEDGYLLVDAQSLKNRQALVKVFKLKHNGLMRILNTGDEIQTTAKSVGTYTYLTRGDEVKTVPVYDPGMPVGPLRERVVTMHGKPAVGPERRSANPNEPAGSGSGFFISENGLFISNAHVVEDAVKVEIKTIAGKKMATVLRVDKEKDLALLHVQIEKGSVPSLSISTNNSSLGTQVFTIGYPLVELQGLRPKFTDGKISSLAGIRDDPDQMQISVPVQPGNSGGPLADSNGDIVGVIVARLSDLKIISAVGSIPQNVNYAVKGRTLIRFLNENTELVSGVKFGRVADRTQEEAIKTVEQASGLVLVYH